MSRRIKLLAAPFLLTTAVVLVFALTAFGDAQLATSVIGSASPPASRRSGTSRFPFPR